MTGIIQGHAVILGHQVDTDRIIPARRCDTADPRELAAHVFEDLDPALQPRLAGALLVAGRNFGCGSSRETAPLALKAAGVRAVLAISFSRIFFRNAINLGLPALVSPTARERLEDEEQLRLEPLEGRLVRIGSGVTLPVEPLPELLRHILASGGLTAWVRSGTRLV